MNISLTDRIKLLFGIKQRESGILKTVNMVLKLCNAYTDALNNHTSKRNEFDTETEKYVEYRIEVAKNSVIKAFDALVEGLYDIQIDDGYIIYDVTGNIKLIQDIYNVFNNSDINNVSNNMIELLNREEYKTIW